MPKALPAVPRALDESARRPRSATVGRHPCEWFWPAWRLAQARRARVWIAPVRTLRVRRIPMVFPRENGGGPKRLGTGRDGAVRDEALSIRAGQRKTTGQRPAWGPLYGGSGRFCVYVTLTCKYLWILASSCCRRRPRQNPHHITLDTDEPPVAGQQMPPGAGRQEPARRPARLLVHEGDEPVALPLFMPRSHMARNGRDRASPTGCISRHGRPVRPHQVGRTGTPSA